MLDRYVELLKNGQVVAFPTETVYGLGADAWNPDAVRKVFTTKGRPADNPLIVHISDLKMVDDFAEIISEDAQKLMAAFWPGPLTLILKKKPDVLDIITAGLDTVALRWPQHPLSQKLIAQAGPLVAPSANSSGKPSPTKAKHVKEDFGDNFPVIDGGQTDIGLESTVLDVSKLPYRIYRPGVISADKIEEVIGKEVKVDSSSSTAETAAKSPGTKYSHYTPEATVQWLKGDPQKNDTILYLLHSNRYQQARSNTTHFHQDYNRMARELYDRFRQADHHGYQKVLVEPFSNKQLQNPIVQALQNRISKAVS